MSTHHSTEAANTDLALRFLAQLSTDAPGAITQFLADDGSYVIPGTLAISGRHTKTEIIEMLRPMAEAFADGPHVTVTGTTAQGSRVAVEAHGRGTLVDGRTYQPSYHFLFEVTQDRFTSITEYTDTHHIHELFLTA